MKYIKERDSLYNELSDLQRVAWIMHSRIFSQFTRDYGVMNAYLLHFGYNLTRDQIFSLTEWLETIYRYIVIASELDNKEKTKEK